MQPKIRVLLVDDHEFVRVGLRTVLQRFEDLDIVGEANSVSSAVAETLRLKPNLVLLDIRLPDGNGYDACRQIQQLDLSTRVLVLTSFADDDLIFESIAAGADGYLLKEVDVNELVRSIRAVASGQSILDPAITARVMNRVREPDRSQSKDRMELLSPQELRILALVAEGKNNKEIAAEMSLSDKTVKNYLSNVLEKLDMTRRTQAAAFFVQHRHTHDKLR